MLVTMFTDASFYAQTKVAAWAMWAKSERGVIMKSGLLRIGCVSSNEAEFKAIANGLHELVKSDIIERGDKVLVTADNINALGWVSRLATSVTPLIPTITRPVYDHIRQLCTKHEIQLITRHVKAHAGTGQPRLWVHTKCDREARRLARDEHDRRLGHRVTS